MEGKWRRGTQGGSVLFPSSTRGMAKLIKQALSYFRPNKCKENERLIVINEDFEFETFFSRQPLIAWTEDGSAHTCYTDAELATGIGVVKKDLSLIANVKLMNNGEITVTERLFVVELSDLPTGFNVEHEKEYNELMSQIATLPASQACPHDTTIVVKNYGRMNIVFNVVVVVNDRAVFTSKCAGKAKGVQFDSPVIVKNNKGTIKRKMEIVANPGEEDMRRFGMFYDPISDMFRNTRPLSDAEKGIMIANTLHWHDIRRIECALTSVRP